MLRRALAPVFALVLLLGGTAPSLALDLPKDPGAFVQELSRYAIDDILKADVSQQERISRFEILLDNAFDMGFIARFVVGGAWNSATPAQRTEFAKLFRDMNVINWGSRFDEYGGQRIQVVNVQSQDSRGGRLHEVTTAIGNEGDKAMVVVWVLRENPENQGRLGVIDLKVEGVSMAQTFRSEYLAVLKSTGSMDGLNQVLRDKIASLNNTRG
ncbi:MlaC/ttg2D family ABC transporter substrate-binding protein [Pararhodospirillum oryzae]|uniref:Toluene tolerance protein n=1 Tax=Pararhodospirillum oryzae TaxID=478448 RepID=A0A512H7L5_9PROT|nr:ABC transporter substrate-binding protein [Pararhodospirillum oryzae]GEO81431.1 toluene tolerance protein [Pararhodospirillum oryzae]